MQPARPFSFRLIFFVYMTLFEKFASVNSGRIIDSYSNVENLSNVVVND